LESRTGRRWPAFVDVTLTGRKHSDTYERVIPVMAW
jgi:hypothetical protein